MTPSTSVRYEWERTSSGAYNAMAYIESSYEPDWDSIHEEEEKRKKEENRIQRMIWKAERR